MRKGKKEKEKNQTQFNGQFEKVSGQTNNQIGDVSEFSKEKHK